MPQGPLNRVLIIRGAFNLKEDEPRFDVLLKQSNGRMRFISQVDAIKLDMNNGRDSR